MRKEKLSSLCRISNGYAFKSDDYASHGYRVMRITNVQKGMVVDDDPKFISDDIANKAANFKLNAGDILISLTGNVGRVGRVKPQHLPSVLNQRVGLIRPSSEEINNMYLFQYLNSDQFEREAIQNSNGVAQLNLSSKWIENYEIPLPPLDDQVRIAHLLSKVEGLIAQRKQNLQQLDDLLKSVFLEMFGDPVRNEKGWTPQSFSDLFSATPRIGTTKPASIDGTIPVIRVGEIGEYQVDFSNCKKINPNGLDLDKCRVYVGDILLARAIGSQEHLGKASFITHLDCDTAFDSHVMRIRFRGDKINPIFVYLWLKSNGGRRLFLKASERTSVQFNINSRQISSIKMPLPPIALQNQFATIVEKVEVIKSRYQHSLTELEKLYGALSQKAFKGELDLSRIPLSTGSTKDLNHEIHKCHDAQTRVTV